MPVILVRLINPPRTILSCRWISLSEMHQLIDVRQVKCVRVKGGVKYMNYIQEADLVLIVYCHAVTDFSVETVLTKEAWYNCNWSKDPVRFKRQRVDASNKCRKKKIELRRKNEMG